MPNAVRECKVRVDQMRSTHHVSTFLHGHAGDTWAQSCGPLNKISMQSLLNLALATSKTSVDDAMTKCCSRCNKAHTGHQPKKLYKSLMSVPGLSHPQKILSVASKQIT